MNYFDILLAKKLSGGSPTPPGDTYERKSVTSYPVTDSANYPLPKCDVTVTDADKCEVIVTTDNTITEDSGVYLSRQSGGGNRELDEIVGGSIVWNQLVQNGNFANSTGWEVYNASLSTIAIANGICTQTIVDDSSTSMYTYSFRRPIDEVVGVVEHKYLTMCEVYSNKTRKYSISNNDNSATLLPTNVEGNANQWTWIYRISSGAQRTLQYFSAYPLTEVVTGDAIQYRNAMNIDLTATFGSTIADYIYSLEQSTAGSGIAWLRSYGYLTEDYYGYTANKIESVSVARHVMKDSNDSAIGSYPINPITLRGIPKLNASNQLYYDGDVYEASGRVKRKYGVVDMGTLNWSKTGDYFVVVGSDLPPNFGFQSYSYRQVGNLVCSNYITVAWIAWSSSDKVIGLNDTYFGIKDSTYASYSSSDFKTAMSGKYLIYELATPTTESTSPFATTQVVDADGTEEYIDAGVEAGTRDVAIPVGHDTKYFNGKAYVKPLTAGTSDTISMADMGIMPTSPMYISANGEIEAEYWKQVE